jgi:hypothetical protein
MSWLKDGIDRIANLAIKSTAPQRIESGDPRQIRYLANGSEIVIDTVAEPREHEPEALEEIIRLATRFANEDGNAPVVWYTGTSVSLVIDDETHRIETATFALQTSDVFAVLERLRLAKPGEAWFDQKSFVRLLRIDLAGTLPPVTLLNPVRKVRFENGEKVSGEVRSQRESLGREIISKVESDTELPEEVTLTAPVYKTAGERDSYPVRCSVEVDPMQGKFRLLPLPDELERVRDLAVAYIGERLGVGLPETVPAYRGKP